MKIPNNNLAIVTENKLTDYLLSETHEKGKFKSAFFKSLGFLGSEVQILKDALIQHAIDRDVVNTVEFEFGIKYAVKCELNTPNRKNPCVVSVWLIEKGSVNPILITAYPA
jgi:filamentous hemagglutinin